MIDSRAGRVLEEGRRSMLDEDEWEWVERALRGRLRPPADRHLAAVAAGRGDALRRGLERGGRGRSLGLGSRRESGERLRRAADLEHWPAFQESFDRLAELVRSVAAGERGPAASVGGGAVRRRPPRLPRSRSPSRAASGVRSHVFQAVCSPYRNPLGKHGRRVIRVGTVETLRALARALAASAGVEDPVGALADGRRRALVRQPGGDPPGRRPRDRHAPGEGGAGRRRLSARLERVLDRKLA